VMVAGFDFGGKLAALRSFGALAGASTSGGTLVQTLAATLRVALSGIQVASLNLMVPALGSFSGSGTIAATGDVDFAMRAKLAGSSVLGQVSRVVSLPQPADGIPFRISGTTTNPVFVPDVGRSVGDLVASPDAAKKAAAALGGLFSGSKR
jgi:AsmA protein